MKKIIFSTIIFIQCLIAEGFNIELLSFMPFELPASDITGFAQDNREIGVMGLYNAAVLIDVTDPENPFEIDRIPGSESIWRDLKYWDRHVYIGTEAEDGIKVVDVDDLDNPQLVYTITDVDNSHNIHIDEDGYLYIVGADDNDLWIYTLENPAQPLLVGTWIGEYLHDIEVYNNKLYGAAIYSGFFYILDVSDKSNPTTLVSYHTGTDGISTHDCAVTFDENILITADETEAGHIKFWDISDYENINLVGEYYTPDFETHSSHNIYIQESTEFLYISYYADGTRVLDISDPENPTELGYYDTTQLEGLYTGNWGVYVDLPSGNIISSDIEQGLFVLRYGGVTISHSPITDVLEYSTPIQISAQIFSNSGEITSAELHYYQYEQWTTLTMTPVEEDMYTAVIPAFNVPNVVKYYLTANDEQGSNARYPEFSEIMYTAGDLEDIDNNDFETADEEWTEGSPDDDATAGLWERGIPNATLYQDNLVQTDQDHTENGSYCYITGNSFELENVGYDDIDGGKTTLISPVYDLSELDDVLLTYWRWYTNNMGDNPSSDYWRVEVTNDNGSTWTSLEETTQSNNSWFRKRLLLSDFIHLTAEIQFRFIAEDTFHEGNSSSGGSLVEAALDDFLLEGITYSSCNPTGDINGDGGINVLDIVQVVNLVLFEPNITFEILCVVDMNFDGALNILDVVYMVSLILEG